MKQFLITILLLTGLVLVLPNSIFAWTHCGTPQAESDCPTTRPTHSPRATYSPKPTESPTATPSATPSATPEVILNLPSNATDGLGCAAHECPTPTTPPPTPSPTIKPQSLPATGSDTIMTPQLLAGIFGLSFGFGLICRGLGTHWENEQ